MIPHQTASPRGKIRALGRMERSAALACLVLIASLLNTSSAEALACVSSGPGTYTATVCITAPADGATVTGVVPATATVTVAGTNPGVQRMIFSLAGQYLLTDFKSPYTFSLPTDRFVDGSKVLSVQALMRDGFTTSSASATLAFSNGVTTPPVNTNIFAPTSGTTPAPGQPFVLAAMGDGADGGPDADAVVSLIDSWHPNLLTYLGDVYEKGSMAEFYNWYGTGSAVFGRFRSITDPTIGNHEYTSSQAPGYFDYWDNVPNYYSYDAAGWHVIALNSTSQFGQTSTTSAQYLWLAADLAAHTNACTLVYFHHPVVNVGPEGDTTRMNTIWSLLGSSGVDIALTGHDHDYQRWVPLGGDLLSNSTGITQFVVGSGGHGLQKFVRTDARLAVGFDSTTPAAFGALRLELNQNGGAYRFVNTAGVLKDSGTLHCSGAPADSTAPATPTGLAAVATDSTTVSLTWNESLDDVGTTAYEVYRDGVLAATTGPVPSFTDTGRTPGVAYAYTVDALDAAGHRSAVSSVARVTMPAGTTVVFSDGFETGTIANWTPTGDFSANQAQVFAGSFAARALATGSAAWGYHQLDTTYSDLYYRTHADLVSTTGNVYLLKFRTTTGTSLLGLYVSSSGNLAYRNDVAGISTSSTVPFTKGVWHDVQVHVSVTTGQIEVWLDGSLVPGLSTTQSLGATPVGRIQLGDNTSGRTFTEYFDDVAAGTAFITDPGGGDTTPPSVPTGLTATTVASSHVDLSWNASTDDTGVANYGVYRDGALVATVNGGTGTTYSDQTVAAATTYTYAVDAVDAAGNASALSASIQVTTPGAMSSAPVADTYVSASKPTTNYGTATSLRVNASPTAVAFLRFDVQGLAGPPASATLRVCPVNSSSAGVQVRDVTDDTWGEITTTYANAPAYSSTVTASSGPVSSGVCVDLDVTSLVTGSGPASFGLTTTSTSGVAVSSRESTLPPSLIVQAA